MKKFITTTFVVMVAVYGYSQTYLPLTGGTLTGELVLTAPEERKIIGYFRGPSDYNAGLPIITHRYQWYSEYWDVNIYRGGGADIAGFSIGKNGNNHLTISSAGNTSLSGALTGTSAMFSDYISARGHNAFINNSNGASWSESALEVQGSNNPGIGFHWPSQYGASLYMNSSGILNWSGAGLSVPKISSTGHSAFVNNSNGASWSESALEVQGSNNPGIGFHWPSQ